MSQHVLSLLVEDRPGLLTRVAGLFARRGFNIESLAVGTTEVEGLSRITAVVNLDGQPLVLPAEYRDQFSVFGVHHRASFSMDSTIIAACRTMALIPSAVTGGLIPRAASL